tara:strand:+ start:337 stop:567 length:231 start_codon:yes stop_codon:yes gene_type:complete
MIPGTHPWAQLKLEFKDEFNSTENINNNEPKLIRKKTNNYYSKPKPNYKPTDDCVSIGYYKFEDMEKDNECHCNIS